MQDRKIVFEFFLPKVRISNDTKWKKEYKNQRRKERFCLDNRRKENGIEKIYQSNRKNEGNIIAESNMDRYKKKK
jgi:hypothetical protein